MKKTYVLINQKTLRKHLGSLFLFLSLLMFPIGAWAEDVSYDLWIGNVQVTVPDGESYVEISDGIKVGYAKFVPGNDANILELHGIQTKGCIKSGLGNLSIKLFGHNRIGYIANEDDNPAIYSTNGGTLTLTKGSTHASLYVETMNVTSVIYGFEDFNYMDAGFNVEASGGLYSQSLGLNDGNYGVMNATFYTGDLYPLWVGETQVSSANLSDIKDDNISEGTVSYNPDTNTLTMTNVTADMASDDNCFIESTITDLKVNLLGTNEVTLNYGMYQTDNCFARLKTGTGSLTFETQRAQNLDDQYVFGSLTVNLSEGQSTVIDGSSDKTLVAQGYTISNTFGGDAPCWRISDDLTDQVKVLYVEDFGLTVSGVAVTSENASNVLGAVNQYNQQPTVVFDADNNKLTLNGVIYSPETSQSSFITNGYGNLTINVLSNNIIRDCNLFLAKAGDAADYAVTITTGSDDPCDLSFYCNYENPWYSGHTLSWQNGMGRTHFDYGEGEYGITLSNIPYLTVAGVPVFDDNVSNIIGTNITVETGGNVSYDVEEGTLTLNKATINGQIKREINLLDVYLIGTNYINPGNGNAPFLYTGTFTDGVEIEFESSEADDGELYMGGTVSESGTNGSSITLTTGGFTVSNTFDSGKDNNNYGNHSFGDWMIEFPTIYGASYKFIYFNPHYGLTVGGYEVTKKNKDMITDLGSGDFTYTPNGNILHIPDNPYISGNIVQSHRSALNVAISGDCAIKSISFEQKEGFATSGTLTIMKDAESTADINKLTLNDPETGAISGFAGVTISEPLVLRTPATAPETWDENTTEVVISDLDESTLFGGGNGTVDNPYVISTPLELKLFATKYNNQELTSNCYVELGDDIDCTGLQGFTPIGSTPQHPFVGTFDGKGKKIIGLTYDAEGNSYYAGLFYVIGSNTASGSVSNLILENCAFKNGNDYNGGIAGTLDNGTIESCTVTSCNILSTDHGPSSGGIVGEMIVGSITNCTVSGSTITATSTIGSSAGGIVAYIDGSWDGSATVSGCQVTGTATNPTTITGSSNYHDSASNCTGGIFGYCSSEHNNINISENWVSGNTTISSIDNYGGDNTCAGAIVGNKGNASFSNNYYYYTVTTSTKNGDEVVERSGYQQRGTGYSSYDDQLQVVTEDYDIDGAVLYTKLVTLPGETEEGAVIAEEGTYYGVDATETGVLVAPGQTTTLKAFPGEGYVIASLTVTNTTTNTAIPTESEELGDGIMQYTFEMPDASVSVAVTAAEPYELWIAGTQVTTANAANVLGELNGKEEPTVVYDAVNHKLTLDGATINGGITWSESADLTIKVIGENSIDNSGSENGGNCIYNNDPETRRLLTFERGDANNACSLSMVCRTGGFNPVFHFTTSSPAVGDGLFWAMSDENHALVATSILGGGAGTSESPILITSATELSTFAAYVNTATQLDDQSNGTILTKYVKLSDDFASAWPSTSTLPQIKHFGGTFDGNGKTITGLKVDGFSMFKTTGGKNITVKDLTLDDLQLSFVSAGNADPIGGIVDYLSADQTIDNCVVKNTTIECGTAYANPCIGGIAGYNTGGTITNCSVEDITINAQSTDSESSGASSYAGGILGNLYSGTVTNCRVMGTSVIQSSHTFSSEVYAGAIIGHRVDASSTLTNNYYDYSVSTKTKAIEEEAYTTKSGYEPRALGYNQVQNPQTEEYEQVPDVTTNNAAMMYTKLVTLNVGTHCGMETDFGYELLSEPDNRKYYFAPDQQVTVTLNPDNGYSIEAEAVTLTYTKSGAAEATVETLVNSATPEDVADYIYQFTVPDANASFDVTVNQALDIEFVDDNSWASYYATENLTVPTGLTAYIVSDVDEETGAVTVASVGYIPKNNAVLLEREQNGAASGYTAAAYTGNTTTVNNLLSGSPNTTDISSLGSGPVYVLFNDKFKRAISGTIPARRAYLALDAAVAPVSAPQYLTISIVDGNSTAINTLAVDDNSNDSWYTIDGLKLNGKPQRKGLYIKNGKKVYFNNNK